MGLFFAKVSWKTLWGCSKGGKARCWDCFLGQNDLMALASFNFIALTHKTVVNSGTCDKFIFVPDYISYLCEILLYICPEITFCNLRCDNQANFPPRQQRLDKCHFNDDEHLGFVIGYQAGTFSSNRWTSCIIGSIETLRPNDQSWLSRFSMRTCFCDYRTHYCAM